MYTIPLGKATRVDANSQPANQKPTALSQNHVAQITQAAGASPNIEPTSNRISSHDMRQPLTTTYVWHHVPECEIVKPITLAIQSSNNIQFHCNKRFIDDRGARNIVEEIFR